jgi:hypothetical protein
MWLNTFDQRLTAWNTLRESAQTLPIESALLTINSWWYDSPWKPYYLHWDDQPLWPDPWQLLSENIYCDLARALGILYTISLLDRADMTPTDLVLTEDGHNLVLVGKEKYILNWKPDTVVNTNQELKIKRQYQKHQIT